MRSGERNRAVVLAAAFVATGLADRSVKAGTYSWLQTASSASTYNWTTTANWSQSPSAGVPNAAGDIATINTNIAGAAPSMIISLNGSKTVGVLNLGDTNATHDIDLGGTAASADVLTFNNSGSTAQFTQLAGAKLVDVWNKISLSDNLLITNNAVNSASSTVGRLNFRNDIATNGKTITANTAAGNINFMTGIISGAGSIIKTGASNNGTADVQMLLNTANTYSGGTSINQGTVIATTNSVISNVGGSNVIVSGSFGTGAVNFASGTTLWKTNSATALSIANQIDVNGDMAIESQNSSGTSGVAGTITFTSTVTNTLSTPSTFNFTTASPTLTVNAMAAVASPVTPFRQLTARIENEIKNNGASLNGTPFTTFTKAGTGELALAGTAYLRTSGALNITGGILNLLGTSSFINPAGGTQVTGGGTLTLTNTATANNGDRLQGHLTLNGGGLNFSNSGTVVNFAETVDVLNLPGNTNSIATSLVASPQTSTLTLTTLNRSTGALLNFSTSTVGSAQNKVVIGGQSAGTLPTWMSVGGNFAKYDATNGVTSLGTADYTSVNNKGSSIGNAPAAVYRIQTTVASGADIALGATTTAIQALLHNTTGTATINTAGKTLQTNGIMVGASTTDRGLLTIGATAGSGTLTSATPGGELVIINNNDAVTSGIIVNATIANNSTATAVTFGGNNNIGTTLNTTNTYTGQTSIAGSTLKYGIDNAISTGNVVVNGQNAILNLSGFSDTVGTVTLDNGSISSTTGTLSSTGSFEMKNGTVSAKLGGSAARAFTLTELLIVIAILTVLMAFRFPTLRTAKRQSQRTQCLGNLRNVHQVVLAYSLDYDGRVPLGHFDDQYQLNLLMYETGLVSSPTRGIVLLGRLFLAGKLKYPQAFYCPVQSHDNTGFNAKYNPWPPAKDPTLRTRIGYNVRPTHPTNSSISQNWPNDGSWPATMPLFYLYGDKAMMSDIVSSQPFVDEGHLDGANVLYGNGAAHWVLRKVFEAGPDDFNEIVPGFSSVGNNTRTTNVWLALDKAL